jgi:hypothetical protein
MRSAHEKKALDALDDAIADLTELRPLLRLALARDDQTYDGHERDIVHQSVKRMVKNVIAIAHGACNTKQIGHQLAQPIEDGKRRVASVPDCIVCNELALPRPRRGMCEKCYKRWTRSQCVDLADFQRQVLAESA